MSYPLELLSHSLTYPASYRLRPEGSDCELAWISGLVKTRHPMAGVGRFATSALVPDKNQHSAKLSDKAAPTEHGAFTSVSLYFSFRQDSSLGVMEKIEMVIMAE
jgi:hypothetical protein